MDVGDSWSTVGVGYASRWDLSILIERSSPMRFERLSLRVYDHSSVIDEKNFYRIPYGLELIESII